MNFRNDLCEIAKQLLAHYGTGPEETHDFRKAGVSLFRKINGKVYAPIGGGITSASTSVRAVEETDKLLMWADNLEKHIYFGSLWIAGSCSQNAFNEAFKERFAPFSHVMNELKKAQIEREFFLRDPSVRSQPRA